MLQRDRTSLPSMIDEAESIIEIAIWLLFISLQTQNDNMYVPGYCIQKYHTAAVPTSKGHARHLDDSADT